jgi:hypothetical protein
MTSLHHGSAASHPIRALVAIDTVLQSASGHCPARTRHRDRPGSRDAAMTVACQHRNRSSQTIASARIPGRAIGSPTTRRIQAGAFRSYGMIFYSPVPPSASSALKGNLFSNAAISASEIVKRAGSIGERRAADFGAAAEAKLAEQARRAATPPSGTPRKTAGAASRRAAPSLASSPRSNQCAVSRELKRNSGKENRTAKNANILKGRCHAGAVPQGTRKTMGVQTQKERPPALPQAAQV